MEDVTMIRPPISILTCAVVAPLVTSMILPLRTLRALIFLSSLRFGRCSRQKHGYLLVGQINLVEELVELPRGRLEVLRKLLGVEDRSEPADPNQAVDTRRGIKPAPGQVGGEVN